MTERVREKERERDSEPQPTFNPPVVSLCHPCITTTHLSYRFTVFETSATALCGTIGITIGSSSIGTRKPPSSPTQLLRDFEGI